jgi:hypothetical protein
MVQHPEVTVIREVEIPEALISLRSDNIMLVDYKKNVTLDVELQMRMRAIFNEMTGNRKSKFVFSADEGFSITREARENGARLQKESPIQYYALVTDNLAYRILANFYIRVVKPYGNYRLVRDLEEGIAWLHSLPEPA